MIQRIQRTIAELLPHMVKWRRHLHRHPELSFQEHDTLRFVVERLQAEGIAVHSGVGRLTADAPGTGAIALLKGGKAGSNACIALRADMDALPILESGDKPYASEHAGVMHACGHDAHTAMLLGAGIALHRLRAEWSGTVMLVFQPGEEKEPGGASLLVKEGVFNDPAPLGIIGQHVTPELPVGRIGFRAGPFMAAADEIYLTVRGRGGHAAVRHTLVDPVLITAHLLPRLYDEARAAVPYDAPMVLSFGKVVADGATNIVPGAVWLEGTLRTFDEAVRARLHDLLRQVAEDVARGMGGSAELHVRKGSPVVKNDPALTGRLRDAAVALVGAGNVVDMDIRMGAEDFAYYTHVMPGCFYRLGTGNPAKPGTRSGLHTSTFDIDEDALAIGAAMMAWGAVSELAAPSSR